VYNTVQNTGNRGASDVCLLYFGTAPVKSQMWCELQWLFENYMYLDNSENNKEMINIYTCDEAYILNTFLLYHTLAALK